MTDALSSDLTVLKRVATAAPDSIDRWLDLCEAAERLKDFTEVLYAGDQIARLAPGKAQPQFIRGLALHRLDRIEEAIAAYRHVLDLHPAYLDAWINLGECCQFLNRIPEAEDACKHAIAVSGQGIGDDEAQEFTEDQLGKYHWNLALLELLKGDYRRGFARYPARFKAIAGKARPLREQPLWRGEDLTGKTLLVSVDQGHGDTLLMARYLPLLKARGAKVVFQVQPALAPYLKEWDGADEVLEGGRDPVPPFDYHASEFDLPHYFGTSLLTVPASVPYLPLPRPDAHTELPDDGVLKVALTWSGNPDHRNDKRRSVPLQAFEPLFGVKDVLFFAANRDLREGDKQFLSRHPVVDLAPVLSDFQVSAQFIKQMDLVISCDTSIAHLAGGMGKPLWVLLPFAPSWCWMLDRLDSPWYPTARLFRQQTRGDWGETMGRLAAALADWSRKAKEKRA